MGERVVEKVPLTESVMGVPTATVNTVKNALMTFLSSHKSAIQQLKETKPPPKVSRLLVKIPEPLKADLHPCSLPVAKDAWSPSSTHFFDEVRSISVARALLDMRSSSQYAAMQFAQARSPVAESLPRLMLKYFERLYGEDVSRHKASSFLEACLQYQHPALGLMKGALHLDESTAASPALEIAVWITTETRNLLISRGHAVCGEEMVSAERDLSQSLRNTVSVPVTKVNWMLVRKSHAIAVCDEILRLRGSFGPHTYLQIFDRIDQLPPTEYADNSINIDNEDCLVDLERVLEIVLFEYVHIDAVISALEHRVFGEFSLSLARSTVPRDISESEPAPRQISDDDQDLGFGPYHLYNLSRARATLKLCLRADSLRTGQLSADSIAQAFFVALHEKTNEIEALQEAESCMQLVRVAMAHTKLRSVEDRVSYIDIVAMLLAWEEQHQGYKLLNVQNLLQTLPAIRRSIELAMANDMLQYFSLVAAVDNVYNPSWVMAGFVNKPVETTLSTSVSTASTQLALSTEGFWHKDVNLPSDAPGLLQVQSVDKIFTTAEVLALSHSTSSLPAKTVHRQELERLSAPFVPTTLRQNLTITGEVSQIVSAPHGPAPLALQQLDLQTTLPASAFPPGLEVMDDLRESFSRTMRRVQVSSNASTSGGPISTGSSTSVGRKESLLSTESLGPAATLEIEQQLRSHIQLDAVPQSEASIHSFMTENKAQSDSMEMNVQLEPSLSSADLQEGADVLGVQMMPSLESRLSTAQSERMLTPFLEAREDEFRRQMMSRSLHSGSDELSLEQRSFLIAEAEVRNSTIFM
jgi:hypothetical protein